MFYIFIYLIWSYNFSEEFQPEEPSDDDEATIAREDDNPEEQASELQLLHAESQQTMEDLLRDLPPGYLEDGDHTVSSSNADDLSDAGQSHDEASEKEKRPRHKGVTQDISDKDEDRKRESILGQKLGRGIKRKVKLKRKERVSEVEKDVGDKDFEAEESEEDNEETITEQEEKEGEVNHQQELEELEVSNCSLLHKLSWSY